MTKVAVLASLDWTSSVQLITPEALRSCVHRWFVSQIIGTFNLETHRTWDGAGRTGEPWLRAPVIHIAINPSVSGLIRVP